MAHTRRRTRFTWLFTALMVMLVAYPYFGDHTRGAALGGVMSLIVLSAGVYALRTQRKTMIVAGIFALLALGAALHSLIGGIRGSVWGEAGFTAYYSFVTVAVFREALRLRGFSRDAILGIVSVYLLIGIAYGSLFDLIETLQPGSFRFNLDLGVEASLGFRSLLFFSFMTLTSIGYGDITPVTAQAQSLAILEGVTGVLYVAVLVARIVNAYQASHHEGEES